MYKNKNRKVYIIKLHLQNPNFNFKNSLTLHNFFVGLFLIHDIDGSINYSRSQLDRNVFIDVAISSIWLNSVIWKCNNDCGRSGHLPLMRGEGKKRGTLGVHRRKFMTSRWIETPLCRAAMAKHRKSSFPSPSVSRHAVVARRNEVRRKAVKQSQTRHRASRPPVIELVSRPRTLIKILASRM